VKTIYKYILQIKDEQVLQLPQDCVILSLQVQNAKVCLWVLLDNGAPTVPFTFYLRGTGHDCDDIHPNGYIGTCQFGSLVFHLFQKPFEV
jgi:hypothetical protein